MSFFVKGKRNSTKFNKGRDKSKKQKLMKPQSEDEESIGSSEEELSRINRVNDADNDDDISSDDETPQEKKLRIAKIYLEEIRKKEQEREESESEEESTSVAKILKNDYLRATGKLQTTVASKYTGVDTDNIKILKCKQHRRCITCICVTSQFIFSGSKDATIVKWTINECKRVGCIPYSKQHLISNIPKKVTGHMKTITSLVVSTDGKFLAAADTTSDIQIWDPNTLKHIETLKGHRNSVTGLVFRKGTHTLYSCSRDKSVKVWSLDEMAYVETLYGHQNHITSIDALTRERAITSGGVDGTIRIWKIVEESQLIYNCPSQGIDIVRLLNEQTFISGGVDGAINVWGINKKKPLCTSIAAHELNQANGEPNWICSIATFINTDLIATGSYNGQIKVWKLGENSKQIALLFNIEVKGFINCLAFTEDGNFLIASVSNEHKLGRWNIIEGVKNSVLKIPLLISNKK